MVSSCLRLCSGLISRWILPSSVSVTVYLRVLMQSAQPYPAGLQLEENWKYGVAHIVSGVGATLCLAIQRVHFLYNANPLCYSPSYFVTSWHNSFWRIRKTCLALENESISSLAGVLQELESEPNWWNS